MIEQSPLVGKYVQVKDKKIIEETFDQESLSCPEDLLPVFVTKQYLGSIALVLPECY